MLSLSALLVNWLLSNYNKFNFLVAQLVLDRVGMEPLRVPKDPLVKKNELVIHFVGRNGHPWPWVTPFWTELLRFCD
jgi:hypothetical protein